MKAFGIGLAAGLFIAAMASSAFAAAPAAFQIPAEGRKAGMAAAPALIEAAKLPCKLTDAWQFGSHSDSKGKLTFYEVACQDAIGYVIVASTANPVPETEDCIRAAEPVDGKPSNIACKLPGNANPAGALQALLTPRNCTASQISYMGSSADMDAYEATCTTGGGYVVQRTRATGAYGVQLCAMYGGATNAIHCTHSTQAQQDAQIDAMASAAPKPCQPKARRVVGSLSGGGGDVFEIACTDGVGYIMEVNSAGKVTPINCVQAVQQGVDCTLTDTRQAQTDQVAVYSDLAKKAGFDCTVSKYADFPARTDGAEAVELACSNRPDGGVGIFPPRGTPIVYDCLRSQIEGYSCTFTDTKPLLPKLSDALKAKGKGSCTVADARPYGGTNTGATLIEVACSDGGPGWVIEFPKGSNTASELLNCAQAAGMGGGGCQLATNKK